MFYVTAWKLTGNDELKKIYPTPILYELMVIPRMG